METYLGRLRLIKQDFPFVKWQEMVHHGLEQYTKENCEAAQGIFDELIEGLAKLGEQASEEQKIKLFEKAVVSLNQLNDEIDGCLIETGEREQLCELFNKIAVEAGIDPEKYGDGEGPASEWRDW